MEQLTRQISDSATVSVVEVSCRGSCFTAPLFILTEQNVLSGDSLVKHEVVCRKQPSTRTVSVQVADGEQSVHRDGTKHPVIKIDHVVKHDAVY